MPNPAHPASSIAVQTSLFAGSWLNFLSIARWTVADDADCYRPGAAGDRLLKCYVQRHLSHKVKGKGSPFSITERRVPELIPVLGSQLAGDVS